MGGDSHGWGLIGTKALWHNRSKIKTVFGTDVRSGAVVRVSLDTNANTLSYSLVSPGAEPRLEGRSKKKKSSGEWGLAFSNISPGVTLYPAVALYQKGDTVRISRGGKLPAAPCAVGSPPMQTESPLFKKADATLVTEERPPSAHFIAYSAHVLERFRLGSLFAGRRDRSDGIHSQGDNDWLVSCAWPDVVTLVRHPLVTHVLPSLLACMALRGGMLPLQSSQLLPSVCGALNTADGMFRQAQSADILLELSTHVGGTWDVWKGPPCEETYQCSVEQHHEVEVEKAVYSLRGSKNENGNTPFEGVTGSVHGNIIRLLETTPSGECLMSLRASEPAADGSLTLAGKYKQLDSESTSGAVIVSLSQGTNFAKTSTASSRPLLLLEVLLSFVASKFSR